MNNEGFWIFFKKRKNGPLMKAKKFFKPLTISIRGGKSGRKNTDTWDWHSRGQELGMFKGPREIQTEKNGARTVPKNGTT